MTRQQAIERMPEEINAILRSLAMPTTGNNEQDEAFLVDGAITTAMMAAGFCPNGCGELRNKECPKCGFMHN